MADFDCSQFRADRVRALLELAEFWADRRESLRARRAFLLAIACDPGITSRLEYSAWLFQSGADDEAIGQLSSAWETAKHNRRPRDIASACEQLAVIHRERGEWALAKSFQQQAVSARLRAGSHSRFLPGDFLALANDSVFQGDLDAAEQFAEQALSLAETRDSVGELADGWGSRGAIALLRRKPAAAWRCFLKAYCFHCRARNGVGRLADLLNLAAASRQLGWWSVTRRLLVKAQREARKKNRPRTRSEVDVLLEEAERVEGVALRTPEWN